MDPEVVAHDKLIQGKVGYSQCAIFFERVYLYFVAGQPTVYFSENFLWRKIKPMISQITRKISEFQQAFWYSLL